MRQMALLVVCSSARDLEAPCEVVVDVQSCWHGLPCLHILYL
jgi:hypothetical protein